MVTTENLRFLAVCMLLAGSAFFLAARGRGEIIASRPSFDSFPYRLGSWAGQPLKIDPDVRETLGPGDFLLRDYTTANQGLPVNLFVAYFPSQRAGDTLHSPKNCLPGAGWTPLRSSLIEISLPGRAPFAANRYLISKGSQRGLAIYWYWAHGRAVASEYWAKFYLVEDSIRLNRSDGSLIRVATEIRQNESPADAQRRLLSLLSVAVPRIDVYVPR
ncbi:MAG TPA: EpsI family protein [Verrucomicrobiae bacterium]|nr:EpsI family protein [Verrucomicrobiae bacterium]